MKNKTFPISENMVAWYDPRQLLRTGLEVLVSTWIGRHSDQRRIDALNYKPEILDYRDPKYRHTDGSCGFDYVADTGDGWDSTYSVAWLLSQPFWTRAADGLSQPALELPRSKLLVFGGDQVYPYPTHDNYQNRLNQPYKIAGQPWGDSLGDLLAIPGNHDWYDSLVGFRKRFCSGLQTCQRTTRQCHSYFVAGLDHGWWIFGVDTQLDADLDDAQFDFLMRSANQIGASERVILCVADPAWFGVWAQDGDPQGATAAARAVAEPEGARLERLIVELGDRLQITLASDEHIYRRDSSSDGKHLIACGNGGAFLHPTHTLPNDPKQEFSHRVSYPDQAQSRALTIGNLWFMWTNPRFGWLAAFAYLAASWSNGLAAGECYGQVCIAELGAMPLLQWREAFVAAFHSLLLNPVGAAVYALIFASFIFFSDRPRTHLTLAVGIAHALTHIVAGVLIYWAASYLAVSGFDLLPKSIGQYLLSGAVIFALGWVIGSFIFGLYLYLSLNVFGLHANEAFSALRNPDYKGFLRFIVQPDGRLDMWAIGIDKVCRQWEITPSEKHLPEVRPHRSQNLRGRVIDHINIGPTRSL